MANLLQEIYEATAKIIFEGKNKDGKNIMKVLVPFCQTDKATSNNRTYTRALMTKQIERVQSDIESGKFLGTSSHNAKLDNVSHIVNKAFLDKNGQGWMEAKIIPTTKGKNLMTIVKNGGRICVSTRGFGNVKNGIVQDDYFLKGIDCVLDGAYEKGTFNKSDVFESVDFFEEDKGANMDEVKKEIEKEKEMTEALKLIFNQKKNRGTTQTWEQFFETNEALAREHYDLPAKEKDKRIEKKKTPSPLKKMHARDFVWESMMSGIPASKMAEIHNSRVDVVANRGEGINLEEERNLRRMFIASGDNPEQATKRIEERRGQKIKPDVKPEMKEMKKAAKKLSEESSYSYDEALKVLEKSMKDLKEDEINMGARSLQNFQAGYSRK